VTEALCTHVQVIFCPILRLNHSSATSGVCWPSCLCKLPALYNSRQDQPAPAHCVIFATMGESRSDLLAWINELLQMNVTKIECVPAVAVLFRGAAFHPSINKVIDALSCFPHFCSLLCRSLGSGAVYCQVIDSIYGQSAGLLLCRNASPRRGLCSHTRVSEAKQGNRQMLPEQQQDSNKEPS